MSDVIVTIAHLRKAGMCTRTPRQWFAKHGLSWNDFVTHGIPESELLATGDSLAHPVIAIARAEAEADGE